jgi:hypothetical protein
MRWPSRISRRGPGVKSFTPDPSGPSGHDPLATAMIIAYARPAGRTDRDALAGLRLGGGSAQSAPPSPGPSHGTTTTPCRAPAARRARGAGASLLCPMRSANDRTIKPS